MKLTKIEAWNSYSGLHTYLRRYYTNPDIEHTVSLYPDEVVTYTYKDSINQIIEPGIHHFTRPSPL